MRTKNKHNSPTQGSIRIVCVTKFAQSNAPRGTLKWGEGCWSARIIWNLAQLTISKQNHEKPTRSRMTSRKSISDTRRILSARKIEILKQKVLTTKRLATPMNLSNHMHVYEGNSRKTNFNEQKTRVSIFRRKTKNNTIPSTKGKYSNRQYN